MQKEVVAFILIICLLEVNTFELSSKHRVFRQTSKLNLNCSSEWNMNDQDFTVTVHWTISNVEINNINYFEIISRQYDSDGEYVQGSYEDFSVNPQANNFSYSIIHYHLSPVTYPVNVTYTVTIYHKDRNTNAVVEKCEFLLKPPNPSPIKSIEVKSYKILVENALNQTFAVVQFLSIQWSAPGVPAVANLSSLGYQVWIGASEEEGQEYDLLNITMLNDILYGTISISDYDIEVADNFTTLYMKMRCFYEVTFDTKYRIYSTWSSTEAPIRNLATSSYKSSMKTSLLKFSSSTQFVITTTNKQGLWITTTTSKIVPTEVEQSSIVDVLSSNGIEPSVSAASSTNNNSSGTRIIVLIIIFIFIFILLLIVSIVILALFIVCIRRRRKFKLLSNHLDSPAINEDELVFLHKGRSQPSLQNITCQTLLDSSLDFSDEWEIPLKSVIIIKRLGEGFFGEVFKGEIVGFKNSHIVSYSRQCKGRFVAVKVLKSNASNQEKNDFLKEIELMKKIAKGNNPHVVNMIGAVTLQEPMCVVTEFLEHGDLLSFLKALRKKIKFMQRNEKEVVADCDEYDKEGAEVVDLASFAYQISSGMEYLASLKILHRDLACRNILVGKGQILKVSDFGMSRNVTYDSAYIKTTNGPQPIRWMAPESILYHEFTTASDVWSFGITLWEIGTLGGVPYPNIDNHNILNALQNGHRNEKPKNISEEIYAVMMDCWDEDPTKRPSFNSLRKKFDSLLSKQNNACELYLDLNVTSENEETRRFSISDTNRLRRPTSNIYIDNSMLTMSQDRPQVSTNILGSSTPVSSVFASTPEMDLNGYT